MNRKRDETKKSGCDVLKKITLLCAVFLLCIAVLPAAVSAETINADYSWYGDGSSHYFTISDVYDLIGFANIVNGVAEGIQKDAFEGKTVRLTNDIDLTGKVWTPIGSSMYDHSPTEDTTKMFAGTFDGCGHTIKGLSDKDYSPAYSDVSSGEYSFGLFGYAYGANFFNVNLEAVSINACTKTISTPDGNKNVAGAGVAALVGYYFPKNGVVSVIENCHVQSGSVNASNNMGGLIGFLDSKKTLPVVDITIKDCSNAASVKADARQAGGILGLLQSSRNQISELSMQGSIVFENCENTGDITTLAGASPVRVGGILGDDSTENAWQHLHIIFDRCKNSGKITAYANGETHAAGIGVGLYTDSGSRIIVNDCENIGVVTVLNPANSNEIYAGGLISHACTVELISSTSKGAVKIGDAAGNLYVGYAKILFVDGIDEYNENSQGRIYFLNGGRAPERDALHDGSGNYDFIPVKTAYKDGASFDGWYANPECTGVVYGNEYSFLVENVDHPQKLYAKWGAANVTFNANGGSGVMTPITGKSSSFSLPHNTFTRAGYVFNNWNTNQDGTGTSYDDGDTIDSSVNNQILYAQWKGAITFNANGGTGEMNPQVIQIHQLVTLAQNTFEYDGYSFAGWNTKPYGTGISYVDGGSFAPVENMILHAQWRGSITFDANGGTGEMNPQVILRGHTESLPLNTFTRTGYVFNNWNTMQDGTGISYDDTIPSAENMVLYANWTVCNDHAFTNEVVAPEYLKSPATYTQKAVYYKSCTACGASSEGKEGEATFEHGDVLEKVTSSQGSSSSGGTYTTMIRDALEEGGEVLFKNSASMVESVTVPAGIVEGKIVVSAITDADAPEGKDVEELFEVNIIGNYPAGKESVITVSLPKSELTKRGLTEADACIYHFDGGKWEKLTTTYEVNGDSIIYHGTTTSFSPFALVYEIGGAVPKENEEPVDEPTEQPPEDIPLEPLPPIVDIPTETPETPMPIVGLLAGIGCAAVLFRRK